MKQLIFIVHTSGGGWGKGATLLEAKTNAMLHSRHGRTGQRETRPANRWMWLTSSYSHIS